MFLLRVAAILLAGGPPTLPPAPGAATEAWRWDAPAECPGQSEVRARIAALVGRTPASDELVVDARIEAGRGGYTMLLAVWGHGPADTRRLAAASCTILADAAALVAAVMVDPLESGAAVERIQQAAAIDGPDPTPPVAPTLPRITPRIVSPPAMPAEPRAERPWSTWLRARGGGEFGAVPGGTGGLDLAIGFGRRRVRGELLGAYWFARSVARLGTSMRVALGTITPRVCGGFGAARVSATTCAGLELGVLRAALPDRVRRPLWLAPQLEVGLRVGVHDRVALALALVGAIAAVRPEYRLEADDRRAVAVLYRPGVISLRAVLGIEVRLAGPGR